MPDKFQEKVYSNYTSYYEVEKQPPMVNNPNRWYVEENMNFHYSRKEYFQNNINEKELGQDGFYY